MGTIESRKRRMSFKRFNKGLIKRGVLIGRLITDVKDECCLVSQERLTRKQIDEKITNFRIFVDSSISELNLVLNRNTVDIF